MLPITRVVLFKHGVGYFQRTGEVQGRELMELSFKASQMNDVLKSLTALDFDGGTFAALSYDSEEPIERKLAELNIQIPEKGAISAFLDRLKGARVSLPHGDQPLQGAVVGIEEVQRQLGETTICEPHLAILADQGKLVRVPLLEVGELSFLDETVRRDLQTLLDVLFSGLRKDRKRLSIQAIGEGKRRVSLGYVVEAPVWKTSYRIVLPGAAEQKPLLQGWALVDNTTEDDWRAVSLSLVAGLPISFVHDLYTPRYRQRPVVRVEEEAAVAPPVLEAGEAYEPELEESRQFPEAAPPGASLMRARRAMAPPPAPAAAPMGAAARASVQVQTRTQEVGDLFAYDITQPVDVGRGRSALVPILQADVDVERVAIYNAAIREKNPMTAFRIKNTTGLTLEGGPVTVFEAESYVGEAMLDTLRRDDERITPYSVELGVTVKHESRQLRQRFTKATRHGQYIHKHYRALLVTQYELRSRLERVVPCYVDHKFTYNTHESPPNPVEVTDSFWRYRVVLKPGKTTKLEVTEIAEQTEAIFIPGIAATEIRNLVDAKLINGDVRQQLEQIAGHAEAIARLQHKNAEIEKTASQLESGQARVRDNLKALGTSSDEARLRSKYVARLAAEEEQLEQLREKIAEQKRQIEQEQESINALIEKLKLR